MKAALNLFRTSKDFDRRTGLDKVSGPSRYFLYRLIDDTTVRDRPPTISDYVELYGINDRSVTRAIEELRACRIVDVTPVSFGKGAPRRSVSVRVKFCQQLEGIDIEEPPTSIVALAERVLTVKSVESGKKPKKWLTPYNRMVLAALLLRSELSGAVYGVGGSDLRRIAGISEDGLTSQLSKLRQKGFVRLRVAGLTGRVMFGRAPAAYFLNLGHADFYEDGRAGCVLILRHPVINNDSEYQTAFRLYRQAWTIRNSRRREESNAAARKRLGRRVISGDQPSYGQTRDFEDRWLGKPIGDASRKLDSFFADEPPGPFASYLQMLICRYASSILKLDLNEHDLGYQLKYAALKRQVRDDLVPGPVCTNEFQPAVDAILKASQEEADKIRGMLSSDPDLNKLTEVGLDYLLLPPQDDLGRCIETAVVVSGHSLPEVNKGMCWLVTIMRHLDKPETFRVEKERLGGEVDIEKERATTLGLMSEGKRYPQKEDSDSKEE